MGLNKAKLFKTYPVSFLCDLLLDIFIKYLIFLIILWFSAVVHCDEFTALSADQVSELISSDHLTVPTEEEVSRVWLQVYILALVS